MEIEQKERERIWRKCGPDNINNGFGHDPDHGVDTAIEEHLHLQKEVIDERRTSNVIVSPSCFCGNNNSFLD